MKNNYWSVPYGMVNTVIPSAPTGFTPTSSVCHAMGFKLDKTVVVNGVEIYIYNVSGIITNRKMTCQIYNYNISGLPNVPVSSAVEISDYGIGYLNFSGFNLSLSADKYYAVFTNTSTDTSFGRIFYALSNPVYNASTGNSQNNVLTAVNVSSTWGGNIINVLCTTIYDNNNVLVYGFSPSAVSDNIISGTTVYGTRYNSFLNGKMRIIGIGGVVSKNFNSSCSLLYGVKTEDGAVSYTNPINDAFITTATTAQIHCSYFEEPVVINSNSLFDLFAVASSSALSSSYKLKYMTYKNDSNYNALLPHNAVSVYSTSGAQNLSTETYKVNMIWALLDSENEFDATSTGGSNISPLGNINTVVI